MTKEDDLAALIVLGTSKSFTGLETFPSHSKPGALEVTIRGNEFTCRCPLTHQPDWATIIIKYTPNSRIVESKSVKLYFETFRDTGVFHEHLAKVICDDFVRALHPLHCVVTVNFNVRGGIAISAKEEYFDNTYICGE